MCSLRSKIEELRCLQLLCRFEILAVTATHLDKSVPDSEVKILGMKFIRVDIKGRKGGGAYFITRNIYEPFIAKIYL